MGAFGYFICSTCRVYIALGKPIQRDDNSVIYFHLGKPESPRNSAQTLLDESLWKFLADHVGHPLSVRLDYEEGMEEVETEYAEIGADVPADGIPFEQYLDDWEGISRPYPFPQWYGDVTLASLQQPSVRIEHYTAEGEPAAVAVHVDLPRSHLASWEGNQAEETRTVSVRAMDDSTKIVRALGLQPPFRLDQISTLDVARIAFVHFEQLWTNNRPVAIELLHALPRELTKVGIAGRSMHIALVDLSSGTANEIVGELRNAPSEGIDEPVLVVHYPTMR
jgi:hypothetical protein